MNKTYGLYTFVCVSKKAEIRVEDQEAPCINWVHVRRVCVCTEKQWLEREKAETAASGINIGTYRHTRHPKWAELQWRTNWRLIDVTWLDSAAITTRGESFLNCVTAITLVLLSFSICYWLIFSIITLTIQVISLSAKLKHQHLREKQISTFPLHFIYNQKRCVHKNQTSKINPVMTISPC